MKKNSTKRILAFILIAFVLVSNLFAGTADDLGISGYLEKIASIAKMASFAIAGLALIFVGITMLTGHFGSWVKKILIGILAGGILVGISSQIVSTIFGSSGSGALI